jgi:serine/threonine protein kinase
MYLLKIIFERRENMLDLALLKDFTKNMLYPINCGFESTLFMNANSSITKLFDKKVTLSTRKQKERIIKALELSEVLNSDIFPKPITLLYDDNYNFCAYEMEYLDGKSFFDFYKKHSTEEILLILEQIQYCIQFLHSFNFYITDFNPLNFMIVDMLNLKLIDFDSICYKDSYSNRFYCHMDFRCKLSNRINKHTNIYCFYLLCIHSLLKNKSFEDSNDVLKSKLIKKKNIPKEIKNSLINFLDINHYSTLKKLSFPFTTY